MGRIITHPFREGIIGLLKKHFSDSIVDNFILTFEAETFNTYSVNIRKQLKDGNLILEVRYRNPDGTTEYICDVYSWETQKRTEHHLLKFITDKVKAGKIGKTWNYDKLGKKIISDDILLGKYETPYLKDNRN